MTLDRFEGARGFRVELPVQVADTLVAVGEKLVVTVEASRAAMAQGAGPVGLVALADRASVAMAVMAALVASEVALAVSGEALEARQVVVALSETVAKVVGPVTAMTKEKGKVRFGEALAAVVRRVVVLLVVLATVVVRAGTVTGRDPLAEARLEATG